MSNYRFNIGTAVVCNFGVDGWKLGRVVALRYREGHWPAGKVAPYQVLLDDDHALIYVPEDDPRYCREATPEDLKGARRMDALAALAPGWQDSGSQPEAGTTGSGVAADAQLDCSGKPAPAGSPGYRSGQCSCCDSCPRSWSSAELYSEHYRCAERNGLPVTRHTVSLGRLRVGESVHLPAGQGSACKSGFMQCPTLVRLPPGVRFSDDGGLAGEVRFDPHRHGTYRVDFVAVSTVAWDDPDVGIVRLEVNFIVEGNTPPAGFDLHAFTLEQQRASTAARDMVYEISETWQLWERQALSNRDTCDRILAVLHRLRELLEQHPRLDGGRWWTWLGGFHMNVHKLLENTLFECELYLGHALTFGSAEVRRRAEQNLSGCYQKRRLEAARFMWMSGLEQMMQGEWQPAAEVFRRAASMQDGWGWAVNFGDIWLSESAARLVHGAELAARDGTEDSEAERWVSEAERLLALSVKRVADAHAFGPGGHPWGSELGEALAAFRNLQASGSDTTAWLAAFKQRTVYWCAQVLGGASPFPPKPRPRLEDAAALIGRLPGHNR